VRPNFATRGTTLSNAATVSTSTTETDTGTTRAVATTPVLDPALDLLINKIELGVDPDPLTLGDRDRLHASRSPTTAPRRPRTSSSRTRCPRRG
jgi:hypothetical protein